MMFHYWSYKNGKMMSRLIDNEEWNDIMVLWEKAKREGIWLGNLPRIEFATTYLSYVY